MSCKILSFGQLIRKVLWHGQQSVMTWSAKRDDMISKAWWQGQQSVMTASECLSHHQRQQRWRCKSAFSVHRKQFSAVFTLSFSLEWSIFLTRFCQAISFLLTSVKDSWRFVEGEKHESSLIYSNNYSPTFVKIRADSWKQAQCYIG